MAFKIYFNKKTRHPSISLSGKEKKIWMNLEMTHNPCKRERYIVIVCISNNKDSVSYVRKYVRKDKIGVKGKRRYRTNLSKKSEEDIKKYLSNKNKKR